MVEDHFSEYYTCIARQASTNIEHNTQLLQTTFYKQHLPNNNGKICADTWYIKRKADIPSFIPSDMLSVISSFVPSDTPSDILSDVA